MRADILTLKTLFQKDVRYVIPTFQRPYVWNQEKQWEPLWNDVRNIAEEYIEHLQALGEDKQAKAEEAAGTYFLGAIVLQQQPNPATAIETRHVIDGQQRLTTLQLLLDAAQEVFERDGFSSEAWQLGKLVANDPYYCQREPDHIFKIWPTLVDQEAFRRSMTNHLLVDGLEEEPIVQAHEFFKLQIRQWVREHPETSERRAQALVTALLGLLQMVVIDLEARDDANVIFETLNARGTPLLASDLIKNSILHSANQTGMNSDHLYKEYWQGFDQGWWRAEVQQGRLVRPRIDVYLNYWLIMRTAEEVQSSQVFPRFRRYASEVPGLLTDLVADINEIGEAYRQLDSIKDSSPEGIFLYRWHVMDAGTTTPVVLWLFSNRDKLGLDAFHRSLQSIESYLLRRMICRMTTKDYNKLFLELMGKLNSSSGRNVDELIVHFLAEQTADSRLWPMDGHIKEAFRNLPLYQLLTRGRLRMILEGLEDSLRSPKAEEAHVARGMLTIEHVMPQAWRSHWPLCAEDEQEALEAAQERDRVVQTIGNLTLLNSKLNPDLSNGSWGDKRAGLETHSVLHLNKEVLVSAPNIWDEECIRARSNHLADLATGVWARPLSSNAGGS